MSKVAPLPGTGSEAHVAVLMTQRRWDSALVGGRAGGAPALCC